MTREELIEKEADEFFDKNNYSVTERSFLRQGFEEGINSQLNKDLQELAVVEGKIEVLKDMDIRFGRLTNGMGLKAEQLEIQRIKLIEKLKLDE